MSLNAAAITAAIAAMPVTGVTILDADEMAQSVTPRVLPILYPSPYSTINDSSILQTFGALANGRMWTFTRTFLYIYNHAPVGAGRGLADYYPAMIANLDALLEAATEIDVQNVDVANVGCAQFGMMESPDGAKFYGFTLSLTFHERLNP